MRLLMAGVKWDDQTENFEPVGQDGYFCFVYDTVEV